MLSIRMDGVPQWQDQGPSPIPNNPNTDVLPQKTAPQVDNSAVGAGGPGVLTIDGDEGGYTTDDHIILRLDPNRSDYIQAIVNNVTEYDGPYSPFQSIVIDGISGKDTIDVQDVPLGVSVTTIEAGSELSDQISAVNVGKNHSTSGILGTITVTDPSDQAILNIDDSGDGSASKNAFVTNSAVTGLGLAPGTIGYSQGALAALNIQTGKGGGAIKVNSTPTGLFGTITRLIDNGPYAVTVGNDEGKMQGIQGTLRISNPQHDDTVNLDDSGDDGGSNVTIDTITPPGDTAYGRVRGLAPNGTIEFHIGDVNSPVKVQTGMGYNEVDVLATLAAIRIISHGPDTIVIGSDLSGRAGNVQDIHGDVELLNEAKPRESTNLEINDSADQASDTVNKTRNVTITNSAVTGLAPARISYKSSQLAELAVKGPSVACTYDVQSTPNHGAAGTTFTSIVTSWTDTLNIGDAGSVQGIVGTLVLDAHGRATVKIDDSRGVLTRTMNMTDERLTGLSPGPILYDQSGLRALNIMSGIAADQIGVESTPNNVK